MKNRGFLLPHIFGKIGWFILVPFTIFGLFIMFTGGAEVNLGRFFSATGNHREIESQILNNITIIGLLIGLIFTSCSREKYEDEMISALRLDSLLLALYISVVVLIVAVLCLYGNNFYEFLIYQMFILPLIFLVTFKIKMWRLNRDNDEE
ncbi:MAG: hypothetical protein J6K33_04540 [Alistipes sp.]|nr:hypothetical protein [Alistipes sp.]MBQ8852680.1 hypothetical protein [Alistipes sp.]